MIKQSRFALGDVVDVVKRPIGLIPLVAVSVMLFSFFASRLSQISSQPPQNLSHPALSVSVPPLSEHRTTKGWKVYKNEGDSFSIQYPPDLSVAESISDTLLAVKFSSPSAASTARLPEETGARTQFAEQYLLVYIQVQDNSRNLSLREAIRQIYSRSSINPQKTVFEQMEPYLQLSNIGPQGAIMLAGSIGENPQKSIFLSHKDKVYTITLMGFGGTGGGYSATAEGIFDLMASSIELR